ncbi:hypothetical protein Syun_030857 [Stephania yunnanensis]|uniref:Pentatricopeptide repeat-containing protein n=1 Tax=Stephania yunnanensis TaxID=152371 RepID=A0AAP0E2K1_9MAGN
MAIGPPQHLHSLIRSITSILQTLTPQNPNFSPLNQFSHALTPNLVIQVIKSHPDPHQSLLFFNWASNPNPNPRNYSHTPNCHSTMLDLLISHKMLSTAANFLESTNNLRDFMISRLIRAHGEMGQIRVAIQWLDQAKRIELGRCLCCYNAVLEVLVRGFRVRLARVLFDQIVEEGLVKPDVLTYTLMIKGLCKVGLVDDAMKVFDEMTCRPSLVTYNVVVDGLCKKGLMESAREVLGKMVEEEGGDCLPDTVTFTTLIDGYCKRGELEEARKCMGEMVKRNCEPNVVTYNALINGFCLVGRIDEAKRTMEKMRLSGLRENVATHRSLLQGMCIVGKPDDAAKHLKVMMSVGIKPDVKAYGVVFNGYCKIRRPDRAMEILDEMRVRDIVPSVSSLNALITLLCDLRELDKAIVILKETPWGCSPNFLSYNTVICSLCRVGGRMRDVEELVLGLIRSGYVLDTTIYSLMVEGYSKDGDVEMAMGVLRTMIGKRFIIQLQSFSVFVKELCSKGRASEVNEAFEEMCRSCGHVTNLEFYKGIIDEHLKNETPVVGNQIG